MTNPDSGGYRGEADAFHAYTAGVRPLAEQLHGLADRELGPQTAFGDHAFSRIGQEVGLSQAVRAATQRQLEQVRALARDLGDTAEAVANTWTNMELVEHDAAHSLHRRAGGDLR